MKLTGPPSVPPRLSFSPFPFFLAPLAFAFLVSALFFSSFWSWLRVPGPSCVLFLAFGFPCPFCGGSRSLLAFSLGDFSASLRFNPLVFMSVWTISLSFLLWLYRIFLPLPPFPRLSLALCSFILSFAVLSNWLYLVFFLR